MDNSALAEEFPAEEILVGGILAVRTVCTKDF
jgi:hypothetical protein